MVRVRGVLHNVVIGREQVKMSHHEPESHQGDAGANPREKRPLFRKIIPQISYPFFIDGVSISASDDWKERALCRTWGRAAPMVHVLGKPKNDLVSIALIMSVLR